MGIAMPKIGWVCKGWWKDKEKQIAGWDQYSIYTAKSKKQDWIEEYWPPEKVYILSENEYKNLKEGK
jgi:hypothetical protein